MRKASQRARRCRCVLGNAKPRRNLVMKNCDKSKGMKKGYSTGGEVKKAMAAGIPMKKAMAAPKGKVSKSPQKKGK